jgi:hypothetical protein
MKYLLMYKLFYLFKFLEFVGIPDDGNNNPNQKYENTTDIEKILNANIAIFICLIIIIALLFIILIFQIIKTFKK